MSDIESIGSSEEVINSEFEEELVVLSIIESDKPKKKKKKASKDKKKKGKKDKKDAKAKKGKRKDEDDAKDARIDRPQDVKAKDINSSEAGGNGTQEVQPGETETRRAGEAGEPPPPEAKAQEAKDLNAPEAKAPDPNESHAQKTQAPPANEAEAPEGTGHGTTEPTHEQHQSQPHETEAHKPNEAPPSAASQLPNGSHAEGATTAQDPLVEAKAEVESPAGAESPDLIEMGYDDDSDDVALVGGEEQLAVVKAAVEAAAAAREKKKADDAARKLRKLEEAAAKERKRVEEERRRAEEAAQREEASRLEAQRRMAQEAAGREALRQREAELREKREAELREAQRQLRQREAEKAAMRQAAQRELLQREAAREKAKKAAVGSVKFDEAGSFANFGSFNAKRSLAEAHGQQDKKARTDGSEGSADDSSNDSEDSQASREGQVRRDPVKLRPPSLWTDPSAALQDEPNQVNWNDSPTDLLPREEVATPAAFVEHFARFTIGAWRRELQNPAPFEGKDLQETELAVFRSRQSLQQIEGAVAPLIKQLERNEANAEVVQQLDKMVSLAAKREYAEAGMAYINMALGHKKWNQTHATYAGAVGQNKGCRTYKTYQDKLLEYDKDPVVQKYIQCMRKLVHFAQCIRPNEDVAKHLHI